MSLAITSIGAFLTAYSRATTTARQHLRTPHGTRQPVTRRSTWHFALRVRATRVALWFGAGRAWLVALLIASSMTATHLAFLIAKWAGLCAMAFRLAVVLAGGVVPSTHMYAVRVFESCKPAGVIGSAFVARVQTLMSAVQEDITRRDTGLRFGIDIDMAWFLHFVTALSYDFCD